MKTKVFVLFALFLIAFIAYSYWCNCFFFATSTPVGNSSERSTTGGFSDFTVSIPGFLRTSFPQTNWSTAEPQLTNALTGGPQKDGIPAIDNPEFVPLSEFDRPDSIQAIVLEDGTQRKVYPYNILIWHEIVNDTAGSVPVAITFCPLCGSAIVFDRTLPDGTVTTFGVSGGLLESNMIMYDRATESLWQQSTGRSLAGSFPGSQLTLVPFQLLSLGEIRAQFPTALVLSEATGHQRDYARNPYSGYEETDRFLFAPSALDEQFEPKTIMVVFRVGDVVGTTPWLDLKTTGTKTGEIAGKLLTLTVQDGQLIITDESGTSYPHYFEMWFSVAAQNENVVVF